MLIELVSATAFAVLTWIYFTDDPAPLLGVYAQQGKESCPGQAAPLLRKYAQLKR